MNIGHKIKRLRIKSNLTLEELASRSELTKGFLSQLERDLTSPSIATLNDILEALGTSLSEFFQEEKEEKKVFTEDDFFVDERDGYTINWVIPNAQKYSMEPIVISIEPSMSSQIIEPHEGEEFGYVLNGKVTLVLDEEEYVVKKGQTFYLSGNKNHFLKNDTKSEVKVLWISTPPLF